MCNYIYMNLMGVNIYDNLPDTHSNYIYGWNSNDPIFEELIKKTQPKIIIEVGTWLGASAIHMAKIIKSLNLDTKIYCVDTWLGAEEFWTSLNETSDRNLFLKNGYPQVYYQFLSNVFANNVQDIITPIPNTSHIGYLILNYHEIKADLIYIDGSHEYFDVKNDITNYLNLLNSNGIIFGDDFNWEGVNKAVVEVFGDKYETKNDFQFWLHKKL